MTKAERQKGRKADGQAGRKERKKESKKEGRKEGIKRKRLRGPRLRGSKITPVGSTLLRARTPDSV